MKLQVKGICMYAECEKKATVAVFDRELQILIALCEEHAYEVADKQSPEYIVDCPNCKCRFGVN